MQSIAGLPGGLTAAAVIYPPDHRKTTGQLPKEKPSIDHIWLDSIGEPQIRA